MQFWVYLLRCNDGSYYAGHTDALEQRIGQHKAGQGCDWTKRRLPVELVWTDSTSTREEALAFERRIKGWTRAKKEALIAGDWKRIGELARPPHERPSTLVCPERPPKAAAEGVYPERPPQAAAEGLGTNETVVAGPNSVRPERSAKRVVEGRPLAP